MIDTEAQIEEDIFDPYATSEEDRSEAEQKKHEELARAEIERRIQVYRRAFSGEGTKADIQLVMLDLAQFCRLNASTYRPDPREHALLEGRREVAQRIMDFTRLDREALFKKYYGSQ